MPGVDVYILYKLGLALAQLFNVVQPQNFPSIG